MATVYKRGKTWWVRFQWRGQEIRQSARTTSKGEARDYLDRLRAEYRKLDLGGRPRVTFDDAAVQFIAEHVSQKKLSTVATYQSLIKTLNEEFGGMYLDEITKAKIAEFEGMKLRTISLARVRQYRIALSGIFNIAMRRDWVEVNPCRSLGPLRVNNARTRYLTRAEWSALYADLPPPIDDIAGVAVSSGMRLGEVLALDWRDLNFDTDEISIRSSKSGAPRTVPMEGASAHFPAQRGLGRDPVFRTDTGARMRVDDVSKRFTKAAVKAGVDDFSFHDLRHTFASWWVQEGGDLYPLQLRLGHKGPTMTQRYAHLRTEHLRTKAGAGKRNFFAEIVAAKRK